MTTFWRYKNDIRECQYSICMIWVRSRNCGCLVTWFCYPLIAKPGNKAATVSWPDPYAQASTSEMLLLISCHFEGARPSAGAVLMINPVMIQCHLCQQDEVIQNDLRDFAYSCSSLSFNMNSSHSPPTNGHHITNNIFRCIFMKGFAFWY